MWKKILSVLLVVAMFANFSGITVLATENTGRAANEAGKPVAVASRMTAAVTLDGKLMEAGWNVAANKIPGGTPGTFDVMYDNANLYLAINTVSATNMELAVNGKTSSLDISGATNGTVNVLTGELTGTWCINYLYVELVLPLTENGITISQYDQELPLQIVLKQRDITLCAFDGGINFTADSAQYAIYHRGGAVNVQTVVDGTQVNGNPASGQASITTDANNMVKYRFQHHYVGSDVKLSAIGARVGVNPVAYSVTANGGFASTFNGTYLVEYNVVVNDIPSYTMDTYKYHIANTGVKGINLSLGSQGGKGTLLSGITKIGDKLMLTVYNKITGDYELFETGCVEGDNINVSIYWANNGDIVAFVNGSRKGTANIGTDADGAPSSPSADLTNWPQGTMYLLRDNTVPTSAEDDMDITVSAMNASAAGENPLDYIDLGNIGAVTSDLILPDTTTDPATGMTAGVTWTSSNPAVVSVDGTVVCPTLGQPDVKVTLTASCLNGTYDKDYVVTVLAPRMATASRFNANIPLTLDGKLMEAGWNVGANAIPGVNPGSFDVMYDDTNLYLGIKTNAQGTVDIVVNGKKTTLNIDGAAAGVVNNLTGGLTGTWCVNWLYVEVKLPLAANGISITKYDQMLPLQIVLNHGSDVVAEFDSVLNFIGDESQYAIYHRGGAVSVQTAVDGVQVSGNPASGQASITADVGNMVKYRFQHTYVGSDVKLSAIGARVGVNPVAYSTIACGSFAGTFNGTYLVEYSVVVNDIPSYTMDTYKYHVANTGVKGINLSLGSNGGKGTLLSGITKIGGKLMLAIYNKTTGDYELFETGCVEGDIINISIYWENDGSVEVLVNGKNKGTANIGTTGTIEPPTADLSNWPQGTMFLLRDNTVPTSAADNMDITISAMNVSSASSLFDNIGMSKIIAAVSDLTLPSIITDPATGMTTAVTWTSSNPAVVGADGKVVRPALGEADAKATLTASYLNGTFTKEFYVTVLAPKTAMASRLNANISLNLDGKLMEAGWNVAANVIPGANPGSFDVMYDNANLYLAIKAENTRTVDITVGGKTSTLNISGASAGVVNNLIGDLTGTWCVNWRYIEVKLPLATNGISITKYDQKLPMQILLNGDSGTLAAFDGGINFSGDESQYAIYHRGGAVSVKTVVDGTQISGNPASGQASITADVGNMVKYRFQHTYVGSDVKLSAIGARVGVNPVAYSTTACGSFAGTFNGTYLVEYSVVVNDIPSYTMDTYKYHVANTGVKGINLSLGSNGGKGTLLSGITKIGGKLMLAIYNKTTGDYELFETGCVEGDNINVSIYWANNGDVIAAVNGECKGTANIGTETIGDYPSASPSADLTNWPQGTMFLLRDNTVPTSAADNMDITMSAMNASAVGTNLLDTIDLGDTSAIVADMDLPTTVTNAGNGMTASVTWATSDPVVITPEGKVERPVIGSPDAVVILTATYVNGIPYSKSFTITVKMSTAVIIIDGIRHETLADGLAATDGGLIKLLWDVEVQDGEDMDAYTIDLNGKTMTLASGATAKAPVGYYWKNNQLFAVLMDSALSAAAKGLQFSTHIGYQVMLSNAVAESYDKIYIKVCHNTDSGVKYTTIEENIGAEYGIYVYEYPILSTEMRDSFAIVFYGEKNGDVYEGEAFNTSVRESALEACASYYEAGNTAVIGLLVDMLNYGAESQKLFGYKESSLANAGVLMRYAVYATQEEPVITDRNAVVGNGTLQAVAEGLELESSLCWQLAFVLSEAQAQNYEAHIAKNGVTTVIDGSDFGMELASSGLIIVKAPILLTEARNEVAVSIFEKASGMQVSPTYLRSVEGGAYQQLNGSAAEAVIAMMKYCDAANRYFAQ